MANFDGPRDGSIDPQVDVASLSLAATFGPVAFPKGMPEHLKQSILEKAEQTRTADGSIGGNQMANDDRRRQAEREEAEENLSTWANAAQQQREEREREEWAKSKSTVAGVTMTGAEWAQLAERLRSDSKFKEDIIAAFRQRGMTEDEAEQRYERVTDITSIAAKPPSQRTEAEAERFEKAQADPKIQIDLKDIERINARDTELAASRPNEAHTSEPAKIEPARPTIALADGPGF